LQLRADSHPSCLTLEKSPLRWADTDSVDPNAGCRRSNKGDYMDSKQFFEQTASSIAALDRVELKRRIRDFRGRFKLDFTEDYLDKLNIDRLRHILLAAHISAGAPR